MHLFPVTEPDEHSGKMRFGERTEPGRAFSGGVSYDIETIVQMGVSAVRPSFALVG